MKKTIPIFTFLGVFCLLGNITQAATTEGSCLTLASDLRYASIDANTEGEVSNLQSFLLQKGYISVKPTGYLGNITVAGVKRYQKDHGISATGYVGPLTRLSMIQTSCMLSTKSTTGVVVTQAAPLSTDHEVVFPAGREQFTAGQKIPVSVSNLQPGYYDIELTKSFMGVAGLENFSISEYTPKKVILESIIASARPGDDYRIEVTNQKSGVKAISKPFTLRSSNPNAGTPVIKSVTSPQNRNADVVINGELDDIQDIYIGTYVFQRNTSFIQTDRTFLKLSIGGSSIPSGRYTLRVTSLDYDNHPKDSNVVYIDIPVY